MVMRLAAWMLEDLAVREQALRTPQVGTLALHSESLTSGKQKHTLGSRSEASDRNPAAVALVGAADVGGPALRLKSCSGALWSARVLLDMSLASVH